MLTTEYLFDGQNIYIQIQGVLSVMHLSLDPQQEELRSHEMWMREAILEAKKAEALNEVPIGAVVVYENTIVGRGYNLRERTLDGTAHAEIIAIREASHHLEAWRLLHCRLYVTLEPCPMCAGAIVQCRVPHVIYGTPDPKAGCAGTIMNLLQQPRFNHQTDVTSGILQEECAMLLTNFFRRLRGKPMI